VCGSCKTRILEGDYTTTSSMTLTAAEIAQGYVLACSCQLQGDVTLA
jgi:NADH oxidoreductase Hcr